MLKPRDELETSAALAITAYVERHNLICPHTWTQDPVFSLFPSAKEAELIVVGSLNCLLFHLEAEAAEAALSGIRTDTAGEAEIITLIMRFGLLPKNPNESQKAVFELRTLIQNVPEADLSKVGDAFEAYLALKKDSALPNPVNQAALEVFRQRREHDSAAWTYLDSIEFILNCYLPEPNPDLTNSMSH